MKKVVFAICILALAAFLVSCTGNVRNTKLLNELVTQNIIQNELNDQNETNNLLNNSDESDPVSTALAAGERFFSDVFTSDGIIWQFMPDGTINAYENDSKVYNYTYELSYSGVDFANKYIKISFDDGSVRKFRFKKTSSAGFDAVYTDDNGNDSGTFTFIRNSFCNALFEKLPYFNETFYESNIVWNFKPDGTLKAYDVSGEVYDYVYTLTYSDSPEGTPEKVLTITDNAGMEDEKYISLKIVSFTASQFSCLNITEGADNTATVITFTKQ